MGLLLLLALAGLGAAVAASGTKRAAPRPEPEPDEGKAPAPGRKLRAENRPATVQRAPRWPGPWALGGPAWAPKEWPQSENASDVHVLANAAFEGRRLFPGLRAIPGGKTLNRSWPHFGLGARDAWERGDEVLAGAAAAVLFQAAERADAGALKDALYETAAGLDLARLAVILAEGGEVGENDEFFRRLREKRAAYDAKMRDIVERGLKEFKDGNWIGFVATLGESIGPMLRGVYDGVRDVFRGSHGGPAAIHLSLPWTAAQADERAHRAWLAAKAAGVVS